MGCRKQGTLPEPRLHKRGHLRLRVNGHDFVLGQPGSRQADERYKAILAAWSAGGALAQRIRNRQNLSRRKVVKRNSTHQFPAMTSPPSKPKQNSNPSVQSPSMNPRPTLIQKPITTPTPELSAYQQQVVLEHHLMWNYIKCRSDSFDSTCIATEGYGVVVYKTPFRL